MFDSSQRSLRGLLFQYAPIYNVLINLLSSSFTKPLFSHVPGTCHLKRYAARKRSGAKRTRFVGFVFGVQRSAELGVFIAHCVAAGEQVWLGWPRREGSVYLGNPHDRGSERERERGFGKCQQMAQLIWQAHQFKYSGGGALCIFATVIDQSRFILYPVSRSMPARSSLPGEM